MWTVPRLWHDQSCFIVCGGESVRSLDLSRLRDRRAIVINSSFYALPDAEFLVFSDRRWWLEHRERVRSEYRGQPVTITPMSTNPEYRLLERQRSSGLSPDPRRLALWHTTVTAAVNLAVHLGAREINFLGLDGRGGWHHQPHPWKQTDKKFHYHGLAIAALAEPLRSAGVDAFINAGSSYDVFPHRTFEEMLG
jgi:hypothetical protein